MLYRVSFIKSHRNRLLFAVAWIVAGISVSFLPLVSEFSVEFAQLSGVLFSLVGLICGITYAKSISDVDFANRIVIGLLKSIRFPVISLILFSLPVFLVSLFEGCISCSNIVIWTTVPPVSLVLGFSVGLWSDVLSPRWSMLFGVLFLLLLAAVVPVLVLTQVPHVYLFNSIWGWFPGPIYDEGVVAGFRLILYRITILAAALCLIVMWMIKMSSLRVCQFPRGVLYFGALLFIVAVMGVSAWERIGVFHTAESIEKRLGASSESDNFRLVYQKGSLSSYEVSVWLHQLEFHYSEIQSRLAPDEESGPIMVFVYKDPWQKQQFTGAKRTSYVPVWSRHPQMHLDKQSGLQLMRHELIHVMLRPHGAPILGASLMIGLTEGVAVALDDPRYRNRMPVELLAAHGAESLPEADELRRLFTLTGFYSGRAGLNYTISGSFVDYLLQNYGVDRFHDAYRSGRVSQSYDKSWDELHAGWKEHVLSTPFDSVAIRAAAQIFGSESIFEKKCARTVSRVMHLWDQGQKFESRSDYVAATSAYQTLFERFPNSLQIYERLLYNELRLGFQNTEMASMRFNDGIRILYEFASDLPDSIVFRDIPQIGRVYVLMTDYYLHFLSGWLSDEGVNGQIFDGLYGEWVEVGSLDDLSVQFINLITLMTDNQYSAIHSDHLIMCSDVVNRIIGLSCQNKSIKLDTRERMLYNTIMYSDDTPGPEILLYPILLQRYMGMSGFIWNPDFVQMILQEVSDISTIHEVLQDFGFNTQYRFTEQLIYYFHQSDNDYSEWTFLLIEELNRFSNVPILNERAQFLDRMNQFTQGYYAL